MHDVTYNNDSQQFASQANASLSKQVLRSWLAALLRSSILFCSSSAYCTGTKLSGNTTNTSSSYCNCTSKQEGGLGVPLKCVTYANYLFISIVYHLIKEISLSEF